LFSDELYGSTGNGASYAEPRLRTESDIAAMNELEFADQSSFSSSENKCSPSTAFRQWVSVVSRSLYKWRCLI